MNILYITDHISLHKEGGHLTVDNRIKQLIRNLMLLGYNSIQVGNIVEAAVGERNFNVANYDERLLLVASLEQYVRLGQEYVSSYSK